ncbi:MAG TPA: ParB N-terminal domain-containing protein [Thermoanaerobaculaceae bacterium]|nr:ParB N-terminal domain-containing protein [Thermoanaerobaculaceae bacterium]
MAETKGRAKGGATRARRRKTGAEPASRGLTAGQVAASNPPAKVEGLRREIEADGGTFLGAFRDPVGGHWHVLAALPIAKVAPTPFQRDLSETHVERLAGVIDKLDRFVDPIVAVRGAEGGWWTPNGHHRLAAVRGLGGRSIVALVLPDPEVAFKILALNTEKAHNIREKALEVIRMARALAAAHPARAESEFALEFEEPALLTLGCCYEKNGRFAGGAYNPVLRRVERFLHTGLPAALAEREGRADRLLVLDDAVGEAVKALKARGFESPYLKAFVVARINPLRFQRGGSPEFDATVEKMVASARRFDAAKVKADQVAAAVGGPTE